MIKIVNLTLQIGKKKLSSSLLIWNLWNHFLEHIDI